MKIARVAVTMALAGLMTTSAMAQDGTAASQTPSPSPAPAPEEAAPKPVTLTTGLDFTSSYFFRGIRQQHSGGTILQPYIDVGVAVGNGITLNVGNWDSIHSTEPGNNFYEADYYGAVTFTTGKLKPGVLYTSYTSPSDSFGTVHELAGVIVVDDSASAFPLSPKAVLAFELSDAQADGGAGKGVYLELGVKPAIQLAPKATLLIPVKLGLSLKDYYEGPLGNDTFGYYSTGAQLSVPAISGKSGALEIHGGVDFQWLGNNLKLLNDDDRVKPIALIGFTYTY